MIKDVGKPTKKPIVHALTHLSKKSGAKPKFIIVRIKDMENDMPNDIKAANKNEENFLSIFIIVVVNSLIFNLFGFSFL